MKNLKAYIVAIAMCVLALIPPINFAVRAPSEYWPWWIVMSGFAGFYLLFLRTSLAVKIVAVGAFINCFFSAAPYISFTAYISVVACCYFYVLCKSIRNYDPIFKMLECLLIFNVFMIVMQLVGCDRLLNFGRTISNQENFCFGVVGQHMQSASFSVILAAVLITYRSSNLAFPFIVSIICNSAGGFMCASAGLVTCLSRFVNKKRMIALAMILILVFSVWIVHSGKLSANLDKDVGRLAVWERSLELSLKHPFGGWGIATYKDLFPAFGNINHVGSAAIPWKTAHSCWIQIIFECGYIAFYAIVYYWLRLYIRLIKLTKIAIARTKAYQCLSGLTMITLNMTVHFPTRMIQAVLIIIFFLVYCERMIEAGGLNGKR